MPPRSYIITAVALAALVAISFPLTLGFSIILWYCHRQWETDPPGTLNLTHRFRWFLHEGGADAEGGGADGIGGFEEARG